MQRSRTRGDRFWEVCQILLLWLGFVATVARAADTGMVSFSSQIAPILAAKCISCHNEVKSKGGYRLDSYRDALLPGDSKTLPISRGKPSESELVRRVETADEDDRMPQKDRPLPIESIKLIREWILQGAVFDGSDPAMRIESLIPRLPHPTPPEHYPRPIPIMAMALSHDGGLLFAGGYHEVTCWDAESGGLLRRIVNLPQRIHSIVPVPGGTRIAVAGGDPARSGEVWLLDPSTLALPRLLARTRDVVLALCIDSMGSRLGASGADNAIRVLDIAAGKETLAIHQHADWVTGIQFSPDGLHLASASRDRSARSYSAKTGELEINYVHHAAPLSAISYSSDGQLIATAARDGKVHIWKAADGEKVGELPTTPGEIQALVIHAGSIFTATSQGQVLQHDLGKRALIRTLPGHSDRVCALAIDAAHQRLASASHAGEVIIWDLGSGEPVRRFTAIP